MQTFNRNQAQPSTHNSKVATEVDSTVSSFIDIVFDLDSNQQNLPKPITAAQPKCVRRDRLKTQPLLEPILEMSNNLPNQKTTILVVDDDQTVRYFLKTALKRRGYRILTAPDGETGLALYRWFSKLV